MRNLSSTIAVMLWEQGVIQEEDVDKCRYGLDVFLSSLLEVISILLIAILLRNFFETLLFFAAFVPLRIYAGGYHADTKLRCYLVSLAVYGLFAVIMYMLPEDSYMVISLAEVMITLIITLVYAPVIHYHKKVNKNEFRQFRKISIVICCVQAGIILVLITVFKNNRFIVALALGQLAESLSMILAIVKRKIYDKE